MALELASRLDDEGANVLSLPPEQLRDNLPASSNDKLACPGSLIRVLSSVVDHGQSEGQGVPQLVALRRHRLKLSLKVGAFALDFSQ
jgi:hypothetical protein